MSPRYFAIALLLCALLRSQTFAQTKTPLQIVLVDAKSVSANSISDWQNDGFKAVAVVLHESTPESTYHSVASQISNAKLDLFYWIEVARDPEMATKNPAWMAALGVHTDWQKNYPQFPEPGVGQVAKAFPWVPIVYREAYDAHLARIDQLLRRVPNGWRGLLLNDLQAGPSSCGCGNLQCRWAIDYHVATTATPIGGDDVAAHFVSEVHKRVGDKMVVPVWTTECSEVDLPSSKNGGRPSTGFCGTVGCAHSACAEIFSAQWTALRTNNISPIALLATHTSFNRLNPDLGGGPTWVTNAIAYVNSTLASQQAKPTSPDHLWVVIDGQSNADATKAREAAAQSGVSGVIVSKIKIDQSYEPRMLRKN